MRYVASLLSLLVIVGFATGALGADKRAVKAATKLADEVQNKIISKTDRSVKVEAKECWLHIEFRDNNVAFDLPLQGARVTATDLDDAVVVQSRYMTRKVSDREPEAFERLYLKFGTLNAPNVMQSFEKAIDACDGRQAQAAGSRRT